MKKDYLARELTMEVVVGVFMVVVLLGLGYFTIILSKETWFGTKHHMEVMFSDVMGLRDGDSVVVRGMTVGKVKSISLRGDGVRVLALLDQPLYMRDDYEISVVASSVLGGRYLSIKTGVSDLPTTDDVLEGLDPYDLVADAAELVNSIKKGLVEGGAIENLRASTEEFRKIIERVAGGKGTLGRLLAEDDTVYEDLSSAVASLNNIAGKLERGEGVLGKLMTDDSLYNELEATVKEARAALDDVRETAPIVTFTSIFFGAF